MPGLQQDIAAVLEELVSKTGFHHAFICTEGGLAVAGDGGDLQDHLASVVGLMDVILQRASRDLALHHVVEVTLHDRAFGRIIVRPIVSGDAARMFLVISAPAHVSWRRATTVAVKQLHELLSDVAGASP